MSTRILGILTLLLGLLALPGPATAAPQPGAGWYLAVIDHGPRGEYGVRARVQRLVLVAPDGARHRVLQRKAGRHGGFRLVDWSPDGSMALLVAGAEGHERALRVDVPTGHRTAMRLPADTASVILAPDGSGVLVAAFGDRSGEPMSRIAWDGTVTVLEKRMDAAVLPSPDGTALLTNGPGWHAKVMRVLNTSDGSVADRIRVPGHCRPVRWWDDRRALVACDGDLALLDPATGTFRRLTARHNRRIGDFGHLDARRIGSGLYVQVAGACGYEFLGRKHHGGRVTPVRVPGAVGSVLLLGSAGDRLVIEHAASCDGAAPRAEIGRFDPATGVEDVLVRLGRHEAFGRVLAYGERQTLGY